MKNYNSKLKIVISFLVFFFSFVFYFLSASFTYAADFKSDYQVEYFLSENKDSLTTRVNFKISITNLRSDVYVAKFTIAYPKSFIIHNLKAADDQGVITPQVIDEDKKTKITLVFNSPAVGKGTTNNFYLTFNQENLFKINGNVWEVILPTIENREEGTYIVIVNLPETTEKKISIAKPKPDKITGRQIIWENPSAKTIYAVFGQNQIYQTELIYNLKNPKIVPIKTEIAFPPDTLYQKVYLDSITPLPEKTYIDEDGNFLGQYTLIPTEEKQIIFKGTIVVSSVPRSELLPSIESQFNQQKKYLLTPQKYWQIDNPEPFNSIKTVKEIYSYVVNNLKYDYERVTKGSTRLGATKILSNRQQAVCTEFTDLFVALAREKGIWAREIQGYGFSSDPNLRPLSLISDVLHAWPEYYDEAKKIWIPVDPTWENTSGIDYFSSFDLNHIVFAIHGKRSDYPLPAGMYKITDSKDIQISATSVFPKEKINLKVELNPFPSAITENQELKAKLYLQNLSNVFLWQVPVKLVSKKIKIDPSTITISVLAPGQKQEIDIKLKTIPVVKPANDSLVINVSGKDSLKAQIKVIPFYYQIAIKVSVGLLLTTVVFFILKKILVSFYQKHD